MARKKTMQKKSGAGKLIGGVAIGLVIAIGAGVLGYYTKGYRDWTFGKAEEPPAAEVDHNEQLLITPQESNGIRMLAATEVTEEGKNGSRRRYCPKRRNYPTQHFNGRWNLEKQRARGEAKHKARSGNI